MCWWVFYSLVELSEKKGGESRFKVIFQSNYSLQGKQEYKGRHGPSLVLLLNSVYMATVTLPTLGANLTKTCEGIRDNKGGKWEGVS